jgi:uncharacterized protein
MRVLIGFIVILLVLTAAVFALLWYFSSQLLVPQPYSLQPEFKILEVSENSVTLPASPNKNQFANTLQEGRYNLLWESGYGELGEILEQTNEQVKRKFSLITGTMPSAGDDARLETFIFRRDPKQDHNIDFEEVRLVSDAGRLQAWWIDQASDTAVLMLHGRRRGTIQETLRALPIIVNKGYTTLVVAYRNHGQSPDSPDGFYHYGDSEWQDAEAGMKFLKEQGIEQVILYGFSMGGAVALETFEHYKDAPEVKAMILDSPLLDPYEVFLLGAKDTGLPLTGLLTKGAMMVGSWRSGIDWSGLDQRKMAQDISAPVLLFAGVADTTIPIALVDEFVSKLPDVEYHRLEGVEHVEPWNYNPQQYASIVEAFLEKVKP